MDSNECYFGIHDNCSTPDHCDCMCHVRPEPLEEELQAFLASEADS